MSLTLRSPACMAYAPLDPRYTCEGQDISPPLAWGGIPEDTLSLALIMDDPDSPDPAAPRTPWVHWVLYNLPAQTRGLTEATRADNLPPGTLEGLNDWQSTGYRGPCPRIGRHRYYIKLYALDCMLAELERPTKRQLEKAMQGHVLGQVELMLTYRKSVATDD